VSEPSYGRIDETTAVKDITVDCGLGTSDVAIVDLKTTIRRVVLRP
jgi:hypothetical protein